MLEKATSEDRASLESRLGELTHEYQLLRYELVQHKTLSVMQSSRLREQELRTQAEINQLREQLVAALQVAENARIYAAELEFLLGLPEQDRSRIGRAAMVRPAVWGWKHIMPVAWRHSAARLWSLVVGRHVWRGTPSSPPPQPEDVRE